MSSRSSRNARSSTIAVSDASVVRRRVRSGADIADVTAADRGLRRQRAVVPRRSQADHHARTAGHRPHLTQQRHRVKHAAVQDEAWRAVGDLDATAVAVDEPRYKHGGIGIVACSLRIRSTRSIAQSPRSAPGDGVSSSAQKMASPSKRGMQPHTMRASASIRKPTWPLPTSASSRFACHRQSLPGSGCAARNPASHCRTAATSGRRWRAQVGPIPTLTP